MAGAGTMGSAIAQKFAQEGFRVILADKSMDVIERGLSGIRKTLEEGVNRKVFSATQADEIISRITGTANLGDLKPCDLVVEAIYEDKQAKLELFRQLSSIVHVDCIVATNTSSFSVTELSKGITCGDRFIGLHFFYHAAKNRLVEIIPGAQTSERTRDAIQQFSNLVGKDPILCRDAYGFAVNRYFVPWLNEAARLLQEGAGTIGEIDEVCRSVFGIGMGPFALMNATGIQVAYHSQVTLGAFGPVYQVADALRDQASSGKPWETGAAGAINRDKAKERLIRERMLGIVFFICSQILEEEICSATHLNRGARIGLRWKTGPVEMMKALGTDEVRRLVSQVAESYHVPIPGTIGEPCWKIQNVSLQLIGEKAVITMDQPENMNALSEASVRELSEVFDAAEADPAVRTIFITGSGKAFVGGADIKFFISNMKSDMICNIESFTEFGQQVFEKIDRSSKKVVAVVNGLALGGGLELALCADMILALPKAQFAFPETGIGIFPGLGGTQRTVKRIGKGLGKYLIHTGRKLNAGEAEQIGLVDRVITPSEQTEILYGSGQLPVTGSHELNEKWNRIKRCFEENTLEDILNNQVSNRDLSREELEKIVKAIAFKAPVALKIADQLIDEAKGCASELNRIREVFSTSDALLGLTSIGKTVTYSGK